MTGPGTEVRIVEHDADVTAVVFSPDGTSIASGDQSGMVKVWPLPGGAPKLQVNLGTAVGSLRFAPDGTQLCASATARLAWYDVASAAVQEQVALDDPDRWLISLLSPDATMLAAAAERAITVVDARTGAVHRTLSFDQNLDSAAWSPDGTRLAVGTDHWNAEAGRRDPSARVLDIATGAEISRVGFDNAVHAIAFKPDGSAVLAGSADGTARLFAAASGKLLWKTPPGDVYTVVTFDPSGQWAITGNRDGKVRVLRVSVGVEKHRFAQDDFEVTALSTSPNGRWLAFAATFGHLCVVDLVSGDDRFRYGTFGEIAALTFSRDSSLVGLAVAKTALVLHNNSVSKEQ